MKKIISSLIMFSMIFSLVGTISFNFGAKQALALSPAEVDLNSAGDYAVLAKTAITTTGTSSVVGDVGISPALAADTEGFGLVLDIGGTFATSSLILGNLYAADYTEPTPSNLTTAVSDMEAAYTDANSRPTTVLNAGAGNLAGLNLVAGVYTFNGSGDVNIAENLTLTGSEDDVWIFQIPGTLEISEGKEIILSGGAKSSNIFWVVEGTTTLKANSVFMGNILAGPGASTIAMQDGATLNGRALGQTDVTLIANIISEEVIISEPPSTAKVTILKYVDGVMATAESTNSTAFSMHAIYPGGEGDYDLDADGFNNANPYYATTADMPLGSDYSTFENMNAKVATSCEALGNPSYALVGYSSGNDLNDALNGEVTTTIPSFTNLSSDKFVIVWNEKCAPVVTPPMCEADLSSQSFVSDMTTTYEGNPTVAVNPINGGWLASIPGAIWIWGENPVNFIPGENEVETFTKTFTVLGTPTGGNLEISSDNSYSVSVNGNPLLACDGSDVSQFQSADTCTIPANFLLTGENTVTFTVTNVDLAGENQDLNPAGLLYKLTVDENSCEEIVEPPMCDAFVNGWDVDYYNYTKDDVGMNLPFENWYQKSLYGNPLSANNTFTTVPDAWTGWSYGADKYKFSQVKSDLMFGTENFFPFNTGEIGEAFQNESLSVQNIGIDNNGSYTLVTTPGGKDYHFGLHATGYVTAPIAGDYAYTQISDDDLWVYVNGVLVIDNSGVHGTPGDGALTSGTIPLSEGVNKVELYFAERHAVQSALNFQFIDPLVVRTTLDCPPPTEGENTMNTTVVKMADLAPDITAVIAEPTKWFFYNDETDTINNSLGSFVTGPMTAPIGTGSAQMTVTGTERKNIATYQFKNVKLSDITDLSFATYSQLAGDGALGLAERAPYLHFNVDFNNSDTWQKRLVYVPAVNGVVIPDSWQTWDAIDSGNALWLYSGATWPTTMDAGTTPKTWAQILALYPNAETRSTDSWFGFRVGEPYADGFTGNVDKFVIGIQNGLDNHKETYDFEPTTIEPTPTAKVTIVKYLDGAVAGAESANNTAFSMHAIYPGGEGDYDLDADGFNNPNPYYATTADMPTGSNYSTYENINTTVGLSCSTTPYMLSGYSTGNTLEEAIAGTQSTTTPAFTNLTSDKFVIVWNEECVNTPAPEQNNSSNRSSSSSGSSRRNNNGTDGTGGEGQVLGAATEICNLDIDTYMRVGYENNAEQVHTLKNFLNWYMGSNLTVDGLYDYNTANAVSAFQMKHADKILYPWGLKGPTGIFYKTTLVEAKNKMCPEVILPIPTNLVNWSLNQNQVPDKI